VVIVEVLCLGRQNKATDFWAIREHRRAKYGSSRVKVISKANWKSRLIALPERQGKRTHNLTIGTRRMQKI
jgi:hypothetical protein